MCHPANLNQVLGWLLHQQKSDEIEEVTDEMLDEILGEWEHVAVLVCKINIHLHVQ